MFPLILIVPAVILWWAFVMNITSLISGWWSLAKHYSATSHFEGKRFRFRSAKFGWSNYGGCLTIGVNEDGLYVRIFFLFRPGHPPLFIPWSDIDATNVKGWFSNWLTLRFAQAPRVRVHIQQSLGKKIAAAVKHSWDDGARTSNEDIDDQAW